MKITTDSMQLINVERIKDTKNIRDVKDIDELVASINAHGLINPITVTEEKDGYRLIAGFRRFAAMKQLGAKEIPCVIRNSDKDTLDEISLSENITRMDMTPYEECKAVQHLINKKNTVSQVAKKFGRTVRWVLIRKKLADAGEKVMKKVMDGSIQLSAAAKIADLPDDVFKQEMESCYRTDSYFIDGVIKRNHKDLAKVPFDTAACMTCDKCSSTQGDLFENEPKSYCLDPVCFQLKMHDEASAKVDQLKANGVNARIGEFDSVGKSISYEDDAYSHEIRNEQKKQQAESEGVKKRALVNPENAKVYEYYDYRDLSDYHEETDEEREARLEQEEKEIERDEAREDILTRKMKEQIKQAIRNFGDSGILALFAVFKPYSFICDEEAEKLGIASNYGEIKAEDIPDDCQVGKLAAIVRNSLDNLIDEKLNNVDKLKKIWNIFVRDENIEGRKSLEDLEPTEDEILAEIAMKKAAEENEEYNNDDNNEIDEDNE